MDLHFNFTRKQLEEFIYDVRIQVSENYINIIMKLGCENGTVICAVPGTQIDDLVRDARKNSRKTIDEFIRDYHHSTQTVVADTIGLVHHSEYGYELLYE